ncbi:MAG: signal peptide peptidase SppA [Polaromonas sp.]|uniref:signal peptide peptidase SppA n=1 Tax=Polaromonas sp. TaxID=1869339 RepID=UPI0027335DCA|nr:signal peptide peptidase SppA [Polaromonas sp.]MDP3797400.1 signal peptide peptidase SppA [Polaromonas sp.]
MSVLDVVNAPWAITPDKLREIQAFYSAYLRGEKSDIGAIEDRLGRPLANERKPYILSDGVAVINLEGIIAKKMNLFTQISGGTSTELATQDLRTALADSAVNSIILLIDSPGGTVDGTQALSDQVYAARRVKPIVALASGMMASAAYWIGSAAMAVYISEQTTVTGSIGVVTSHVDMSGAEAQKGIKTTEIYAGKFKRVASAYSPLSDDGRTSIQEQVDYLYSVFVGDVAKNRGVSVDAVLQKMADGRLFTGQQGIEAGLVDGVATLEGLTYRMALAGKSKA